jgi:hypothetical protein
VHLQKLLERQGKPFTNFVRVIKNVYRQKSKKPVRNKKASEIPPQRDNDTNTKVIGLRKHYQRGTYIYHPRLQRWILLKRLKLRDLTPICKQINPIDKYRCMDFYFHLDASCLNENSEDRNKLSWLTGLETIKWVSSLTHDLQEKVWTWKLKDPKDARKEQARGLAFFPEFKEWALSFNHDAAHKFICSIEARLDRVNKMAFYMGELMDKYEPEIYRYTSKRVMLKEINPKTLKFIKETPYMTRLHCYDYDCPVLKLTEIELNEKFTEKAEFSPTLDDGQRGFSFSKLWVTNNWMTDYST